MPAFIWCAADNYKRSVPRSVPHVLLVHGGSHGAWCWTDVQQYLRNGGVDSTAFDLPGSGEDRTPRANLDLDAYIAACISQIDAIDQDVILVGHSLAGLTFPGVIAQRAARIAHALFIAALVTSRGERGIDSIPTDRRPSYYEMAEQTPDNSLLPSFEAAWDRFFPSLDEHRAHQMYQRLTPQPLGPYLQANSVEPRELNVPSTFVVLEEDRTFPVPVAREFAQKLGVDPIIRPGDHCWMITDPQSCANTIVELVHSGRGR